MARLVIGRIHCRSKGRNILLICALGVQILASRFQIKKKNLLYECITIKWSACNDYPNHVTPLAYDLTHLAGPFENYFFHDPPVTCYYVGRNKKEDVRKCSTSCKIAYIDELVVTCSQAK